jgi:iron complex outermembrane receptor protein
MKVTAPLSQTGIRPSLFALALLLNAITDIPAFAQVGGTASTAPTKEGEVLTLDPFSVTAKADASGYGVTSATTITRLNTPLKDIPQTINIVSSKFMKELAAPSLGEAVALMPNVTLRAGAPDQLQVRSIDVFSVFRNSFRYSTGASLNFRKDLSNIDRIEIIKGLGSATTGRGEAGGVVNMITKKPRAQRATSISGIIDNYGYYKTELDTTGPLTKNGKVLYRAIAAYTGGEIYSPNEEYDLMNFYPSLEFRFNDRTNLLIEGSIQSGETPSSTLFEIADFRKQFKRAGTNNAIVSNLPNVGALQKIETLDLRHPVTLPWLDPDAQVYEATITLNHKFTDWLSTRQSALFFKGEVDREFVRLSGQLSGEAGWVFAPSDTAKIAPIDYIYALLFETNEGDLDFASYQGDFLLEYNTGSLSHQTLLGYEFTTRTIFNRTKRVTDNRGYRVIENATYLNLQRSDMLPQVLITHTDRDVMETSYYVQHTTKMFGDRLQLTAGWRYDELKEDIWNRMNNSFTESRPDPTDATYRIGASYRVKPWLSAFAVHAEQKDPLRTELRYPRGTDGVPGRDPAELITSDRTVELDEFGIKTELLDGRLTANLTYYYITEGNNMRQFNFRTNPNDSLNPLYNWTENVVDPSGISAGFEIEVMGAPTDRLSFYASASFPTDETLSAVQADQSILTSYRRGHSDARLNFAGNYLVNNNPNRKIYAQTAFGWTDDVVLNPDNRILQSGSLRWDLGVRVVQLIKGSGAWEVQARVQNVLDQKVITGTGNSATSPRRWSLSVERRF